ncbi:hypothetical protein [Nocardia sp. NPDC002869]|uniref:hypothetical protein n=1 Tax=Nocardia sp. NPDC002869 TaxID=3161032 RepID=UPI00398D1F9E
MNPSTLASPVTRNSGGPYRVTQWATGTIGRRALRDPAAARITGHRGIRRPLPAELTGHPVRPHGIRQPPADFAAARLDHLRDSFGPSLRLLADGIGLPLDEVTAAGEVATAGHTFDIAAGTVEKGTVAAQRIAIAGRRAGHTVVSFQAVWHCGADAETGWGIRPTGWHLSVRRDAPLEIDMVFPFPLAEMAEHSPSYTANHVNAVAPVCAAPPGIRTVLDLPAITANLGRP